MMVRFTSIAAAMALAGSSVHAQQAPAPAVPVEQAGPSEAEAAVMTAGALLRAGEFHWSGDGAGQVLIVVSIADQKLYAWRDGTLFAVSTVSTGRPGHATPTGTFPIMEKHRDHHSNRYANAPMPFMQRLTADGVALHAGKLPGHPASHGCVRLPLAFAERLFAVTKRGGTVVVTDEPLGERVARGVRFDPTTGAPLPMEMAALRGGPATWFGGWPGN